MSHCQRHFEESVAGYCRTCNAPFCERCLVFAFGPKKPPYCIACALAVSGVRSNAGNRVVARPAHEPQTVHRDAVKAKARQGLFRRRKVSDVVPAAESDWGSESVVPAMSDLDHGPLNHVSRQTI